LRLPVPASEYRRPGFKRSTRYVETKGGRGFSRKGSTRATDPPVATHWSLCRAANRLAGGKVTDWLATLMSHGLHPGPNPPGIRNRAISGLRLFFARNPGRVFLMLDCHPTSLASPSTRRISGGLRPIVGALGGFKASAVVEARRYDISFAAACPQWHSNAAGHKNQQPQKPKQNQKRRPPGPAPTLLRPTKKAKFFPGRGVANGGIPIF